MAEKNVDCCVFTSYHNVAYYSNFVYCAFGRPYGLVCKYFFVLKIFSTCHWLEVVGREGEPVSVSALIDGGQPWRRGYGGNVVYTDWARHG